jgi:hypothetical protein
VPILLEALLGRGLLSVIGFCCRLALGLYLILITLYLESFR